MADEKILVEIVLDDGSVQKGFARIQTESAKTSKEVTKDFQTVGDAFDQLSLSNISSQIRGLPIAFLGIIGSVAAVGLAIREAFNLAVEGEKLNALDAQFNRLAASAGLSANTLKTGFENAGQGLADIEEILQSANSAIINLGSSASRLPEILDLSRRVTVTLGGDIEERFAGITRAIETGNARALRQQGIILDTDRALQSYAATLGVATSELTTAQRQQAILNATLEQGNAQYKNISTSVQPLQDNITRLTVAFGDIFEAIQKIVNSGLGGFFANLVGDVARGTQALASFIDPTTSQRTEQLTNRVNELKFKIFETESELEKFANREIGIGATLSGRLVVLNQQLETAKNELAAFNQEAQRSPAGADQEAANVPGLLTDQQIQNQIARQAQLDQLLAQTSQSRIQNLQLELNETQLLEDRRALLGQIADEQIRLRAETLAAELLRVNQEFSAQQGFTDDQREQARLAKIIEFNNQILNITKQTNQQLVANQVVTVNQIRGVLVSGLNSAAQGIGVALAKGTSLFEAFGQGVVGIFGDILITVGNALLVQGLAVEAFVQAINRLLPGSGAAAAAAGLGLIIFGSALKAAVGSRSSAISTPSPTGTPTEVPGFSPISESPGTELTPTEETQRLVDTQVIVNIQGDVLDSEESGSRIVSLINDAFDKKGVQVRRGVTA